MTLTTIILLIFLLPLFEAALIMVFNVAVLILAGFHERSQSRMPPKPDWSSMSPAKANLNNEIRRHL